MRGLSTEYGAATEFGPDGNAAREELIASTLAALSLGPIGLDALTSELARA